jgi:hypothetical protein
MMGLVLAAVVAATAQAADPGQVYPAASEVSDQKAGSVLFYNIYTSTAATPNAQNSRINITNTSSTSAAFVHLFFVDGSTCSVADSFLCLTANQTATFLASDVDPGITGYIVAVASSGVNGCPIAFNHLIGDEYVKFSTGFAANLGAEAFAALYNGVLPGCDENSVTATLAFNGVVGAGYNRAPRVLAISNVGSIADGNSTLLIVNRVGGSLATGAGNIGTIFGLFYDDSETSVSYQLPSSGCQRVAVLSDSFPRLVPRLTNFIGKDRSGWTKFWSTSDVGILGAAIRLNTTAGDNQAKAFNGGHNLHKLKLTAADAFVIPIFPPSC